MSSLMRGRSPWWWSDQNHPIASELAPEPVAQATGLPVAAPDPAGGTDDLRAFAERVLLVSEVMTGYRCPACHGLPASHRYPRYRCGCGQQWDLTRSEQYRLSHEHSPRKLLLRIVSTGELPEIPTKARGER